jgi:lysophospholipase L1-like esterase
MVFTNLLLVYAREIRNKKQEYKFKRLLKCKIVKLRTIISIYVGLLVIGNLSATTVFTIGDSTMEGKDSSSKDGGWGFQFQPFFQGDAITVSNHARSGRSSKSFYNEGRWTTVKNLLQPGDYVIIQFGHNDQKSEASDLYTDPAASCTDPALSYRLFLKMYINDTRAKGATPILMTSVVRRQFDSNGILINSLGAYPDAMREVAAETGVTLIDMEKKSRRLVQNLGVEGSSALYMSDNTHFVAYGASKIAQLAAEGIMEQKFPLAKYIKRTASAYLPMKEDFGGSAVDAATFVPSSTVDFTLEVTGTGGQKIAVGNYFAYTPEKSGTIRFVQKEGVIYVYEDRVYKKTLAPGAEYPDLRTEADNQANQTGIYNPLNKIQNPGFETTTAFASGSHAKDGTYWLVYTYAKADNWSNGNGGTTIRTTWKSEGTKGLLIHSAGRYLTQNLGSGKIKPNTNYKLVYDHKGQGAGNGGANYRFTLGTSEFGNDICSEIAHTGIAGTGSATFELTFKTGDFSDTGDVWLCFHRYDITDTDASKLDWMDRVSLVEGTAMSNVGTGITGISSSVTYLEGAAYVYPVLIGLFDYFDLTGEIVNPAFNENATGWTNAETWTAGGIEVSQKAFNMNQSLSGLAPGVYSLKVQGFERPATNDGGAGFKALTETVATKLYAASSKGNYESAFNSLYESTCDETGNSNGYADNMANAQSMFQAGYYEIEIFGITVGEDGNLTIGVKNESPTTGSWTVFDNFRLYYYGDLTAEKNSLSELINQAQDYAAKKMYSETLAHLNTAITNAGTAVVANPLVMEQLNGAITELTDAIDAAMISINLYAELKSVLDAAETSLPSYTGFTGYANFLALVNATKSSYNDASLDNDAVNDAIARLNEAEIPCKIALPAPFEATFVLSNPSFEDGTYINGSAYNVPEGWTLDFTTNGATTDIKTVNTKAYDGTWRYYIWCDGTENAIDLYQDITLPAGGYKLSASLKPNTPATTYIYAKQGEQTSNAQALVSSSWDAWGTAEVVFPVQDESATVRVGVSAADRLMYDNFRLYKVSDNNTSSIPDSHTSLVEIYPNPTNGLFTLNLGEVGSCNITITNVGGSVLLRQTIHESVKQMDISNWPAGVYLLTIENNKYQKAIKIVKK